MHDNSVIIIGAGASGMMAAITAAARGLQVTLLEKMKQPGLKLRITGKGRCNLTNTASLKETLPHIGSDSRFLRNAYSTFFNTDLTAFFEQRGVPLVEERGGRIFPKSGKAIDIFLALIEELERNPLVTIRKESPVSKILTNDSGASGVELLDGTRLHSGAVILATGGMSYPLTGSTGDGYRMAEAVGHTVTACVPALVPLTVELEIPKDLIGFTVKNVRLSVTHPDGKKVSDHFGDLTFTSRGLEGPIAISASRYCSRLLHEGTPLLGHIDFKPAVERAAFDKRLINDLNQNGNRLFHDALRLWLPAELVPLALKQLHIEYYKRLNQINGAERARLLAFLKDFTFPINGTGSFEEAIVTQGGVNLKEVNPKTMESKLVPHLYLVGEVLDLDADTGGYNLQIAFTTGHAAGSNC